VYLSLWPNYVIHRAGNLMKEELSSILGMWRFTTQRKFKSIWQMSDSEEEWSIHSRVKIEYHMTVFSLGQSNKISLRIVLIVLIVLRVLVVLVIILFAARAFWASFLKIYDKRRFRNGYDDCRSVTKVSENTLTKHYKMIHLLLW
jgi:hypothetical protein